MAGYGMQQASGRPAVEPARREKKKERICKYKKSAGQRCLYAAAREEARPFLARAWVMRRMTLAGQNCSGHQPQGRGRPGEHAQPWQTRDTSSLGKPQWCRPQAAFPAQKQHISNDLYPPLTLPGRVDVDVSDQQVTRDRCPSFSAHATRCWFEKAATICRVPSARLTAGKLQCDHQLWWHRQRAAVRGNSNQSRRSRIVRNSGISSTSSRQRGLAVRRHATSSPTWESDMVLAGASPSRRKLVWPKSSSDWDTSPGWSRWCLFASTTFRKAWKHLLATKRIARSPNCTCVVQYICCGKFMVITDCYPKKMVSMGTM